MTKFHLTGNGIPEEVFDDLHDALVAFVSTPSDATVRAVCPMPCTFDLNVPLLTTSPERRAGIPGVWFQLVADGELDFAFNFFRDALHRFDQLREDHNEVQMWLKYYGLHGQSKTPIFEDVILKFPRQVEPDEEGEADLHSVPRIETYSDENLGDVFEPYPSNAAALAGLLRLIRQATDLDDGVERQYTPILDELTAQDRQRIDQAIQILDGSAPPKPKSLMYVVMFFEDGRYSWAEAFEAYEDAKQFYEDNELGTGELFFVEVVNNYVGTVICDGDQPYMPLPDLRR